MTLKPLSEAELIAGLRDAVKRCSERMSGNKEVPFFSIPANPARDIDLLMSEAARRLENYAQVKAPTPPWEPTHRHVASQERVRKLEEALRPFAAVADRFPTITPAFSVQEIYTGLTVGDLRRASQALKGDAG